MATTYLDHGSEDKAVTAKTYLDHDSEVKRNREARRFVSILAGSILFFVPVTVLALVTDRLWDAPWLGIISGVLVGGRMLVATFHRLVVFVPNVQALVTQDMFRGTLVIYGPGLHAAFPWEKRGQAGNFSLKLITRMFEIEIPTKTSAVTFFIAFQYKALLKRITNFVGVDGTTIEEGFESLIANFLTERVSSDAAQKIVEEKFLTLLCIRDSKQKENNRYHDCETYCTPPYGTAHRAS